MKKIYLCLFLIFLTSCWEEKEVEITFEDTLSKEQTNMPKEVETLKVPEKNVSKINEAKQIPKNQNYENGSNLTLLTNTKDLEIQKINNTITISNGTIIKQEIPENFLENFTDIFPQALYSNSNVDWYAFAVWKDLDFNTIAEKFNSYLTQQSWKSAQNEIPEENFEIFRLDFSKQIDNTLENFSITFSPQVPKLFQEESIFEWKFIEFEYHNFDTSLIN